MTEVRLRALLEDGALAGEWAMDPQRSSIRLKSRSMWGLVEVTGAFREIRGSGTVSPDGKVSGTVTVATASIDTKETKRDTHLRSADFFDVGNFPYITFTMDSIRPAGRGVSINGTLTVRDCTRPLSFDAAASLQDDGAAWFDAEVRINRTHWGLTWNQKGMVSVHNTLTIHTVFTRR
jgi:polyisoprenoid-binding protein YceI